MKKIFIILALSLGLGGCATLQNDWAKISSTVGALTGSTVSPQAVIVAGNTYVAIEATATNYLTFCKVHRPDAVCANYVAARREIIPAVLSMRQAVNDLKAFLRTHPGQLGPSDLYDALSAAIGTAQAIVAKYKIAGA